MSGFGEYSKVPLFVWFSTPWSYDIPLFTLRCTEDEEKQAIGMREEDAVIECDRCAARDSDDQRNPGEKLARHGPYSITVNSLCAETGLLFPSFLLFRFASVPSGIVVTQQHGDAATPSPSLYFPSCLHLSLVPAQ